MSKKDFSRKMIIFAIFFFFLGPRVGEFESDCSCTLPPIYASGGANLNPKKKFSKLECVLFRGPLIWQLNEKVLLIKKFWHRGGGEGIGLYNYNHWRRYAELEGGCNSKIRFILGSFFKISPFFRYFFPILGPWGVAYAPTPSPYIRQCAFLF